MVSLSAYTYRRAVKQKNRLQAIRVYALMFICLAVLTATFLHSSVAVGETRQPARIVVTEGDTLWQLAKDNAPRGMDIRIYLDQIIRVNALSGSIVHPGQTLILP